MGLWAVLLRYIRLLGLPLRREQQADVLLVGASLSLLNISSEGQMIRSRTQYQRRMLIRSGHAALDVVMLAVFVIALYVLGLPSIVAIVLGASLGMIVSMGIRRRLLPQAPPLSDEERLQLPRLRPGWLLLGAIGIALFYFVAHIPLALAVVVIVLSICGMVVSELRARSRAEERLAGR